MSTRPSQSSIRRFIGDMRGDDAPALRHTYPSLALPPRAVGPRPFGFGIADREVATKGCDVRVQNGVLNTLDIACPPQCRDGGVPHYRSIWPIPHLQPPLP